MIYLTETDLATQIFNNYLDESIQDDIDEINAIEKQAIAQMRSKLAQRYDVQIIFSQTGDDRHDLVVLHLTSIVNYRIIRRNAARKVPSDFADAYKAAMAWMNDVRDGNEFPDLPKLETYQELKYGQLKNTDFDH